MGPFRRRSSSGLRQGEGIFLPSCRELRHPYPSVASALHPGTFLRRSRAGVGVWRPTLPKEVRPGRLAAGNIGEKFLCMAPNPTETGTGRGGRFTPKATGS